MEVVMIIVAKVSVAVISIAASSTRSGYVSVLSKCCGGEDFLAIWHRFPVSVSSLGHFFRRLGAWVTDLPSSWAAGEQVTIAGAELVRSFVDRLNLKVWKRG